MEKKPNFQPDPEYDAHLLVIKNAFMKQARLSGFSAQQIPEALTNDVVATDLWDKTKAALDADGIEADSLDMIAAYMEIVEGPWFGGGEEGPDDSGVREPRRPLPSSGSASVALPPEIQ